MKEHESAHCIVISEMSSSPLPSQMTATCVLLLFCVCVIPLGTPSTSGQGRALISSESLPNESNDLILVASFTSVNTVTYSFTSVHISTNVHTVLTHQCEHSDSYTNVNTVTDVQV